MAARAVLGQGAEVGKALRRAGRSLKADVFCCLVLGYTSALILIVPLTARFAESWQKYAMAVTMQSLERGHLQVFYDTGEGLSESRSVALPLEPSDQPHEYRLPLPAGRFRSFRIDPGTRAGRYVIERVAILGPGGAVYGSIPLEAITPAAQISVIERRADRLVLDAPQGSTDPQLLYLPETAIFIPRRRVDFVALAFLATITLLWVCGAGVIWIVEQLLSRWGVPVAAAVARGTAAGCRHPCAGVFLAAVVATGVSTYPVLLLGRSFVAPNTGGVPMLYDVVPFTPGGTDLVIEDGRGSDVWAVIIQDVPHSSVQREALAKGEIPLWNRYNGAGRALWGQGLTYLLDPLHWLTLVTPDPALGWDLKFVAHRFVFSLGVGLAALTATGAGIAAIVVAAAAPFCGAYAHRLNHPAVFALTYAPWVLLAWFQLAIAPDRRRRMLAAVLLVVASALVLVASPPKEAAVALLAVELTGVAAVLWSRGSWRERMRRLWVAALAGVTALLITAPHWLVFLHTLKGAFTAYDSPHVIFAEHAHAVGFFLGPLTGGPVQPGLHILALVLIIAAITAPRRLVERRAVLLCGIGTVVLVAIAFGALPASWLMRIPLLGKVWHIHDAFLTAALPLLLVVTALGADVLHAGSARRAALVTAVMGIVSWWLVGSVRVRASGGFALWAVLLSVPVAVALPWCFYAAQARSGRLLPRIAAASAVSVLLLPGGLHADSGIPVLDALLMQPRPRVVIAQGSPAVDAVRRGATEPARTVGLDSTLFAGSQALYELEGIGGADPLEVPWYRALVDAAGIGRRLVWITMVMVPDVPRLAPLLDMLNVGFFLARSDAVPPGFVDIPVAGPDRLRAGRRATAWPRAFFVDGVVTYVDAKELLSKAVVLGRPFAAIQSTDRQAIGATRGMLTPSGDVTPGRAYKLTVNTTSFVVRASGPGVAVLNETFVPDDFRATLNGQHVPYFRVNHAFKAVAIPSAGDWEVKFEYRPLLWELTLLMACFGAVLLAGFVLSA
jgi:hypothetical protein